MHDYGEAPGCRTHFSDEAISEAYRKGEKLYNDAEFRLVCVPVFGGYSIIYETNFGEYKRPSNNIKPVIDSSVMFLDQTGIN
tara:strand:- start:193 stop:438 length:246 start_codon:yes stop_codon:yes gene_type:complete